MVLEPIQTKHGSRSCLSVDESKPVPLNGLRTDIAQCSREHTEIKSGVACSSLDDGIVNDIATTTTTTTTTSTTTTTNLTSSPKQSPPGYSDSGYHEVIGCPSPVTEENMVIMEASITETVAAGEVETTAEFDAQADKTSSANSSRLNLRLELSPVTSCDIDGENESRQSVLPEIIQRLEHSRDDANGSQSRHGTLILESPELTADAPAFHHTEESNRGEGQPELSQLSHHINSSNKDAPTVLSNKAADQTNLSNQGTLQDNLSNHNPDQTDLSNQDNATVLSNSLADQVCNLSNQHPGQTELSNQKEASDQPSNKIQEESTDLSAELDNLLDEALNTLDDPSEEQEDSAERRDKPEFNRLSRRTSSGMK